MIDAAVAERAFAPRLLEPAGEAAWIAEIRRRGFARFEALGFPTAHDEEWRATGLQLVTGTPWAPAGRAPEVAAPAAGVRVVPLAEASPEARRRFDAVAAGGRKAFAALNAATFADALVVEIVPGAVVAEPITVAFAAPESAEPAAHAPRLLVVAGERSQASVVQTFAGGGRYFTNAVTEIVLADGALLDHTLLQRESEEACHVHTVAARVGRAASLTSHNVAFGAALSRTDLDVELAAEGAEASLDGLFVGRGSQHIDTHTFVDHASPRGTSRQLYKGILDDAARGVFHGKVLVRQDAQKTDAVQTNKNLLLSRAALVNSTPALEILADDVKCKHGSTTGQLDAAALFYLQSRGIGAAEAKALLTWAFAADVAERLRVPAIRTEIERELGLRLAGAPEARA
ncbi:MAG TPA: Fe-S cluster assembly protein SufD [Thermoanaerobaculia bacterium]|nr:Fe-S cluster assembly protein SufD [Thermoanaerobaculia bacterium]